MIGTPLSIVHTHTHTSNPFLLAECSLLPASHSNIDFLYITHSHLNVIYSAYLQQKFINFNRHYHHHLLFQIARAPTLRYRQSALNFTVHTTPSSVCPKPFTITKPIILIMIRKTFMTYALYLCVCKFVRKFARPQEQLNIDNDTVIDITQLRCPPLPT